MDLAVGCTVLGLQVMLRDMSRDMLGVGLRKDSCGRSTSGS